MDYAKNPENEITINLELQKISFNNEEIKFQINDFKKNCLINGLDDIGITLTIEDKISEYEATKLKSWIKK